MMFYFVIKIATNSYILIGVSTLQNSPPLPIVLSIKQRTIFKNTSIPTTNEKQHAGIQHFYIYLGIYPNFEFYHYVEWQYGVHAKLILICVVWRRGGGGGETYINCSHVKGHSSQCITLHIMD